MDKYSIMIGLGLCIGYIYLKNTTIKFMNIQRIDINEINSFLTKDELEYQFERDKTRLHLDFDIDEYLEKYPEFKIFFTQTVLNYIYNFYLVPNLINKNYNLFDKSSLNNRKHIFIKDKNIFNQIRCFELHDLDKEKLIAKIEVELSYKYNTKYLYIRVKYDYYYELFYFRKSFIV